MGKGDLELGESSSRAEINLARFKHGRVVCPANLLLPDKEGRDPRGSTAETLSKETKHGARRQGVCRAFSLERVK